MYPSIHPSTRGRKDTAQHPGVQLIPRTNRSLPPSPTNQPPPIQIDVPPAFVAFSTQVPFLGALAGITYSIMSTSWDPDVSEPLTGRLAD